MTSPASSGGAGPHFEAKVGANYLLSMLLEVDARGLPGCRVESVRLQRSEDGHPLDDIVVEGIDRAGAHATFEVQVKRALTFTAADKEFQEIVRQIGKAAKGDRFWSRNHQLGTAVARTTRSTEPAYQDVLSWARNLENAKRFYERLARPGAANELMRRFLSVFRRNLELAGFQHDDETVWKLLKRVQILVFDFDSPAAPTSELMRERAQRALADGDPAEATKLWSVLITLAQEQAEVAGSKTRPELITSLHPFRLAGSRDNRRALATLFEETELAISGFDQKVGCVSLLRQERVESVRSAMGRARYVEIRGEGGVGKSGLLRKIADALSAEARHLVLSPNRVIGRGWLAVKAMTGYDGDGRDLINELSLSGVDVLFVDNLDFYSSEERVTVCDLLRFAARHPTMRVVTTARLDFGEVEPVWLPKEALSKLGRAESVILAELSEEEVDELRTRAPRLASLLSDQHPARQIVRNLFRLSRLIERTDSELWPATEAEMARNWWELADGKDDAQRREHARFLVKVAKHSLASSGPYNGSMEAAGVIDALKRSGAIQEFGRDQFSFGHDVLREWAFANVFFEDRGFGSVRDLRERAAADQARGAELAARLALTDPQGVVRWRELVASLDGSHETWRRAVVLALTRSENAIKLLGVARLLMMADGAALFKELVRYTLAVEFEPAVRRLQGANVDLTKVPDIWKVPRNLSAAHLTIWSLPIAEQLPLVALPDVVKLYTAYVWGTFGADPITKQILPKLFDWLTSIEADHEVSPYGTSERVFAGSIEAFHIKVMEEDCRRTFLFFCQHTPELAAKYLKSFGGRKHSQELRIEILKLKGTLAQAAPKELADFALQTFVAQEPRQRRNHHYPVPDRPFELIDTNFIPSSPSQGPFLDLLVHAPKEGLRLVRELLRYAVRFEKGDKQDDRALMLCREGGAQTFEWSDFYMWSRGYGNAPDLVVSALMALEAWGHRRIEAGESVEAVIIDILGDPTCSAAVLLIAVDMVISHWPASADAAMPFVACPELLCLEIGRPSHENLEIGDFFGLKELQKEPAGLATLESLKQRASRNASLYNVLHRIAFGPPERCKKARVLLRQASERLGEPGEHSDLGDPRMMALHAQNLLERVNWVDVIGADGKTTGQFQYKAPEDEENRIAPIREQAVPRLKERSLRMAILNELYARPDTTQEFLEQALYWAKKQQNVFNEPPELDWGGSHSTMVEAVVSCATLLARNGSSALLEQEGAWIRGIFDRVYEQASDPVYLHRDGLRYNPPAIAFVGQSLLLQRSRQSGDDERLLRFACAEGYGAAHGYGAILPILQQLDPRLISSLMRCAFEGAVRPKDQWGTAEEVKVRRNDLLGKRITDRVNGELRWLGGQEAEPAWPAFPLKRAKPKAPRRSMGYAEPVEAVSPYLRGHHVDYHRAALWLRLSAPLLGRDPVSWLPELIQAYLPWTQQANGYGGDKHERFERGPSEWNTVYFDAAARSMKALQDDAFEKRLQEFFGELPDEPFMDTITPFMRSADVGHLDFQALSVAQLIRLRAYVIAQLQTTRMFERNKDRNETSVSSDIAPVFAALCFNDHHGGFVRSTCYVPAKLMHKTDPFLPGLENFAGICRSPFLIFLYLNFFEVKPHQEQLPAVLGCSEKWLDRFSDSSQFWVEWSVGRRVCAVLNTIFRESPHAFDTQALRLRVDLLLGRLVSLGVSEAHEVEQLLYRGQT